VYSAGRMTTHWTQVVEAPKYMLNSRALCTRR
jgi:hypothetical protein